MTKAITTVAKLDVSIFLVWLLPVCKAWPKTAMISTSISVFECM